MAHTFRNIAYYIRCIFLLFNLCDDNVQMYTSSRHGSQKVIIITICGMGEGKQG